MAKENSKMSPESFSMNGGDGPYSYAHNSSFQRKGLDITKVMMDEAIAEKLDVKQFFSSLNLFKIADLGCSVGPNTFIAVQNIIEAVELKYQTCGLISSNIFEFQVFFNDNVSNDFNMLFTSLPPERRYSVAGVPGSFHGRLFPKASLHFIHSSYALHWLSKLSKNVVNKGRIHYKDAPNEVLEAYSAQYAKDVECFLCARAQELVFGGLMALIFPNLPVGTTPSQATVTSLVDLLGSSLIDMAKMGIVNEAKVDSFNLPIYITPPEEFLALIERNGCFSIEKLEPLPFSSQDVAEADARKCMLHFRAVFEGLISEHFGPEIIDELFDRYNKKVADSSILSTINYGELFVLLKRKSN